MKINMQLDMDAGPTLTLDLSNGPELVVNFKNFQYGATNMVWDDVTIEVGDLAGGGDLNYYRTVTFMPTLDGENITDNCVLPVFFAMGGRFLTSTYPSDSETLYVLQWDSDPVMVDSDSYNFDQKNSAVGGIFWKFCEEGEATIDVYSQNSYGGDEITIYVMLPTGGVAVSDSFTLAP